MVYGSKFCTRTNAFRLLNHSENSGLYSRIKHILNMEPGNWTVRVKAKNTEGWSTYSTEEAIVVPLSGKNAPLNT